MGAVPDCSAVGWVLDLDGVVWLAHDPIPGAAEAVQRLRHAGERLAFVTNNAQPTREAVGERLRAAGIEPGDDVITAAMAAASLVAPGERVLAYAGAGVVEALEVRGAEIVPPGSVGVPVDTVVVGKHTDFTYDTLRAAARAVHAGARLIATNTDPVYPTPDGLDPGNGALLASVVTAGRREPDVVAGKPEEPIASLVRDHLGTSGVVVGDLPSTDGLLARRLGYDFALVLSGVTTASDLPVDPAPDLVAEDLAAVVTERLG